MPTDSTFNEVKQRAIDLWKEVDSDNDKYGYASGKINRIKDLQKSKSNMMYIFNMFDPINQIKFVTPLTDSTFVELCECVREWNETI
jgi:hypothetical protein